MSVNIDALIEHADWPKRTRDTFADLEITVQKFDPSQPRDAKGQWTKWPLASGAVRRLDPQATVRLEQHYDPWVKSLSPLERESIQDYVLEGYRDLNEGLRQGKYKAENLPLTKALEKAPPPPPGTVVWRGVGAGFGVSLDKFKPGEDVRLNGFQSASLSPELARDVSPGSNITFEIRPTRGAYVDKIERKAVLPGFEHEHEFLIPHGATYRVRGVVEVTYADGTKGTVVQLDMHP